MARALADIITELNSVYNPQRDSYNAQIGTLDPQLQAETQGLEAQKRDSFQQITDQANRRGLFYSGLPIAEEQRYTGSQFLPAVANLRAKYSSQRFGLMDAINKITQDQQQFGQNIWEKEKAADAELEMFNRKLAADAANAKAAAGGGGGGGTTSRGTTPRGDVLSAEDIAYMNQKQLQRQATSYAQNLINSRMSAADKMNIYRRLAANKDPQSQARAAALFRFIPGSGVLLPQAGAGGGGAGGGGW